MEPLLVPLDEVLAPAGELARRQTGEGYVAALSRAAGRVNKGLLENTFRAHKHHVLIRHPGSDLVNSYLAGVVVGDAGKVDGAGVQLRDLGHERAVVGGVRVSALAPTALYPRRPGALLSL